MPEAITIDTVTYFTAETAEELGLQIVQQRLTAAHELLQQKQLGIDTGEASKETEVEVMTRKVVNVAWDAYKDKDGKDMTYQLEENGPEITWMFAIYEMEKED